jgi:DNA-binding XRE family transcriptional regulator
MNKVDITATGNILVEMTPKEWHRASILFKSTDDIPFNIGEELVKFRRKTGVSQEEVASQLGISTNYITLIEWGLARNVSPQLRQRIVEMVTIK